MTNNIFYLPTVDIPCDIVLEGAKNKLKSVLIIGIKNDDGYYFGSSSVDKKELLFLAELFKTKLMRNDFDGD